MEKKEYLVQKSGFSDGFVVLRPFGFLKERNRRTGGVPKAGMQQLLFFPALEGGRRASSHVWEDFPGAVLPEIWRRSRKCDRTLGLRTIVRGARFL
jgi:hypothetical protein